MGRSALPDSADVVVVGGGIMGTSTAYFLSSETDLDVLLVEKDAIASGSTGDSSAILRHHYGEDAVYTTMAWWSHEFYRHFEERTGEEIAYEPNPLVRFGREGEPSGEYSAAGHEVLATQDIPVSRYERAAFDDQYPMLDVDADFAVSDDSAAYSDGADVAGGFSRAAQAAGATVLTGVGVEEFVVADGAIAGVETTDGRVETDAVVLTAGPWTAPLAATVGVDVPITPSREQVLVLDPPAEYTAAHEQLMPTTGPPGSDWYIREDFGEGVLVATHHTGNPVENPDVYKQTPDEDTMLDLIDAVSAFAPGLSDAGLRGEYCGLYSETPDEDFIIDQAGPDGLFLGCGFSGHGFKHGPAVGRILTDLVTRGETDLVDIEPFSCSRFDDTAERQGMATEET